MSVKKNSNISDVAAQAGVSVKTVSRVINNEPHVRAETVKKVQAAIDKLDYSPNQSARSLRSKRSYNIGLIYSNPSPHYITEIQAGMTDHCKDSGYDVLIHPCDYQDDNIINEISNLLIDSKIDGLVLTPPLTDMPKLVNYLNEINASMVCIASGQPLPNTASVYCDERVSAQKITEYLVSLGHTDIGFIMGHPDHGGAKERLQGFKDGLAKKRVAFNENRIKQGYFSLESGQDCADELLRDGNAPTAIFASNDDMAVGAMICAQQLGLSIPDDLSVIGFDDSPIATHTWPRLTTVKQPIRQMAKMAAANLIAMLAHKNPLKQSDKDTYTGLLQCQLSIRESAQIYRPPLTVANHK